MKKISKFCFVIIAFSSIFGSAGFGLTDLTPKGKAVAQRIIPGKSIGDVYIGMPQSEVLRSLGNPKRTERMESTGGLRYEYDQSSLQLLIYFTPNPEAVVKEVDTFSDSFVTDAGVRVGCLGADVVKVYGKDYTREEVNGHVNVIYPRQGIAFWLNPGNSVTSIYIMSPN